ncbi:hypothetical protein CRYUN_Cryun10bG0076200 [Craigia yunnanensis]
MCQPKVGGGMGFKDMHFFNVALLSKQGWRLLQNNNNLMQGVIKARYNPNESFLNSCLRTNRSLVWRGIWEAKSLLLQGFRWRVGNGNSIKIWKDEWLPFNSNLMVQTLIGDGDEEGLVSDLIDPNSHKWRLESLYKTFNNDEASQISMLQIGRVRGQDMIVWNPDNKGEYTVKSGYQWLFTRYCLMQMDASLSQSVA